MNRRAKGTGKRNMKEVITQCRYLHLLHETHSSQFRLLLTYSCMQLSPHNNINLIRRITSHKQAVLRIPSKSSRTETSPWTLGIIRIRQEINSSRRASRWLDRLTILECNTAETVSIWRLSVPVKRMLVLTLS